MPPRGNQPQERVCAANWRRSLCAAKRDPRPRGYTPLGFPKRRSQSARATRTQYYCSRLTPAPSAPFRNSGVPRTPVGGRGRPPCQRGLAALAAWGIPTGFAWTPIPGQPPSTAKGAGCRPPLPLSFATHSQQSVGAGHARPATLLCPRQRAEPFRPASRPPPLKGEASLAGFARASLSKNTSPKAFATAKAFGIIEENHLGRPPHGKARRRRPPQGNGH